MPNRLLYHTWSVRTVSPFAIPLNETGIGGVERELTSLVRRNTKTKSSAHNSDDDDGTYVILAWIPLSPARHLHIDISLEEESAAQILLCFPTFRETTVASFAFSLQRGSKSLCDVVMQWFECTHGCAFGNRPFSPTPDQIAQTLAIWTTEQFNRDSQVLKPLEVTFEAPSDIASAGLSSLSLTIAPVTVGRLLQDLKASSSEEAEKQQKDGLPILRVLQCFIRQEYQMDVSSFKLIRATSAAALLGCDGRIKPLDRQLLGNVLRQIQGIIQGQGLQIQ